MMDRSDQSNFVPANIKDGALPDQIGVRKRLAQMNEIREARPADNRVPLRERGFVSGYFATNSIHLREAYRPFDACVEASDLCEKLVRNCIKTSFLLESSCEPPRDRDGGEQTSFR